MKLFNLTTKIEVKYPLSLQEEWDCSGLLIENEEVSKVLVCLDITPKIVNYALSNNVDLIISHHPLIFRDYCGSYEYIRQLFQKLYASKIALYSIHTNYDNHLQGMNTKFIEKIGYHRLSDTENMLALFQADEQLLNNLRKVIISPFRIYNEHQNKAKVAVLLGSGGAALEEVAAQQCDIFISSEFKQHEILYAREEGIMLIDITHQAERIFSEDIACFLQDEDVIVEAIYDDYLVK